ncbi:hypothetical protein LIER_17429 [Lithospermum erythrorhizon]|uniref:Reverse transcriptase n=1 Tax=Lithospermum erythrorhizon TaxID=34254 RepID=A0AAV3QBW8_LITER
MPSIDPAVEVHILYIDPTFPRIKQKKRLFNIERNTTIREEVQDLLKAQAIRHLLDRSVGHEVFDFVDASRGYHQIRMAPEDEEKIALIIEYGLYC